MKLDSSFLCPLAPGVLEGLVIGGLYCLAFLKGRSPINPLQYKFNEWSCRNKRFIYRALHTHLLVHFHIESIGHLVVLKSKETFVIICDICFNKCVAKLAYTTVSLFLNIFLSASQLLILEGRRLRCKLGVKERG